MLILKFKFDGNLDYQSKAIHSVISLFEGQSLAKETYSVALEQEAGGSQLVMNDESFDNVSAMANQLVLNDELFWKTWTRCRRRIQSLFSTLVHQKTLAEFRRLA